MTMRNLLLCHSETAVFILTAFHVKLNTFVDH